jgi:excisionase family DNA binding protein
LVRADDEWCGSEADNRLEAEMVDTDVLNALRTLLDPERVAAWLDEVESHRGHLRPPVDAPQPNPTPQGDLLTVAELCERLNVQPSWVYERTRQDAIPHLKVGRYIRFRLSEVEQWLRETRRSE